VPDYVTMFLLAAYAQLGLALTFYAAMVFFFGVTALTAAIEHRFARRRYIQFYVARNDVAFEENYSTLADFLLLNPLVVTVIAGATIELNRLPAVLASKVAVPADRAGALRRPLPRAPRTDWLFPLLVVAVVVAWTFYLRHRSVRGAATSFRRRLGDRVVPRVRHDGDDARGGSFVWRIGVLGWYLSRVTEAGLVRDPLLWSIGLGDIAESLGSINWFFALMTLVLVAMAVHDFRLHSDKRFNRKVRMAALGAVVVVTRWSSSWSLCARSMSTSSRRRRLGRRTAQQAERGFGRRSNGDLGHSPRGRAALRLADQHDGERADDRRPDPHVRGRRRRGGPSAARDRPGGRRRAG